MCYDFKRNKIVIIIHIINIICIILFMFMRTLMKMWLYLKSLHISDSVCIVYCILFII